MAVRVSMKILMIFGIDKMPQLNKFWNFLHFTLFKIYEQMLVKLIYLTSPIFVEV